MRLLRGFLGERGVRGPKHPLNQVGIVDLTLLMLGHLDLVSAVPLPC